MRNIFLVFLLAFSLLVGCTTDTPQPPKATDPPTTTTPPQAESPAPLYHNDIFQDVSVMKVSGDTYTVKGKARVFEAVVDYVVEDGHNELAKGSVMASQGAPEWGDFEFTVTVKKARENSTLTLILFETSAKDGSRRMELPISLPAE